VMHSDSMAVILAILFDVDVMALAFDIIPVMMRNRMVKVWMQTTSNNNLCTMRL
jgi:hypothetical protein